MPFTAPDEAVGLARELALFVAMAHEGAAFDVVFEPETFARFILADDREYDSGFWKAPWPNFGGSWFYEPAFGIGTLRLYFDLHQLDVERVVALFVTAARDLGAFFAAAQVDQGHELVDRRPVMTRQTTGHETLLTSILGWRGLPPVPMWLSWFGEPYRELGEWPLPPELTYRYRPPYSRTPDGGTRSNPPEPGDEAETIPPL